MSHNELKPFIDEYIKKVEKVLPEGFETDDFLDTLRKKIIDLLDEKILQNPLRDSKELLFEVFEELGSPEKVKDKFVELQITNSTNETKQSLGPILAIRGAVAGAVVIIAATIMYYTANWDFFGTLTLFSVIVIIEWIYKVWEMKKHS
jgi:hypothetical protein